MDLAIGPYSGKETGETALLRSIMQSVATGHRQSTGDSATTHQRSVSPEAVSPEAPRFFRNS